MYFLRGKFDYCTVRVSFPNEEYCQDGWNELELTFGNSYVEPIISACLSVWFKANVFSEIVSFSLIQSCIVV